MTFDPQSATASDPANSKANAWSKEDSQLAAILFMAAALALALT